MALTEIPSELSSTPSIADGGNATAITIDSSQNVTLSGNVGIGVVPSSFWSGNNALQINTYSSIGGGSAFTGLSSNLAATSSGWATKYIQNGRGLTYLQDISGGTHRWYHAASGTSGDVATLDEAMRISDGNVLVGKTTTAFGTQGIRLEGNNGKIEATRTGNVVMALNRLNDGDILEFYKNSAVVGSIGTAGGDLTVNAESLGVLQVAGASKYGWNGSFIYPTSDNARDLGTSSFRFKEIFLSRGVNFGANANAGGMTSETLDDYEEGNFQPTIIAATGNQPTITYTANTGTYTKVGRLVTLVVYIQIASISGTTTGNLNITGLPFAQLSGHGYASCGAFSCNGMNFAKTAFGSVSQYQTPTLGFLTQNNNLGWGWEKVNILSAGDAFRFTISYHTAA